MPDFVCEGIIKEIIQESPTVKRFIVETTEEFNFISGQFIVVSFPGLAHMYPYRSYSLACAPQKNIFELCVVLKEDGAATPVLFDMECGTKLKFTKPLGSFILPQDIDSTTDLCLICTGTGVAPFRGFLQHLTKNGWNVGNVYLIFGCRTNADLLYRKEFEYLASTNSSFHYIPVLSREKWDGKMGYVHTVYLENETFMNKENMLFYICGWSEMVKETKNNLKEMGYSRKQIKFELYD
jgi:NAD(P)H-flavin reductase